MLTLYFSNIFNSLSQPPSLFKAHLEVIQKMASQQVILYLVLKSAVNHENGRSKVI